MDSIDLRARLTAFRKLLWRASASSFLLVVMLTGIVVGYAARPFADLLWDHPMPANGLFVMMERALNRAPDDSEKVIRPDPTPFKILPTSTTEDIPPLVRGLGEPKHVKIYRVNPNGSVIEDDPSASGTSPI